MIIRTSAGLHYNGWRSLKVGDTITVDVAGRTTEQKVEAVNVDPAYSGPIKEVLKLVRHALPAGVKVDGGFITYEDRGGLAGDGTELEVNFFGDGATTFYTSGDDFAILTKAQVEHLVKALQENR